MFTQFEHPEHGTIRTLGFPIHSACENIAPHQLPPACGEHTRATLEELRLSAQEIEALHAEQVVFQSTL